MTFWLGFFCGMVALPGVGWCLAFAWYAWRFWRAGRRVAR